MFIKYMNKAGDGGGSGGTGGEGDGKKVDPPQDWAKEIEAMKAQNAELIKRLDAMSKNPEDDPELLEKARKQKSDDDKKKHGTKAIENALKFSLQSENWLKNNLTLLPKDAADIFKQAEKETYDSPVEKDAAIKSGLIQSYFQIQANLDLLTGGQKTQLDEYLKLTKAGKEQNAQAIYDSIFEPTLEMSRKLKRAEALSKGFGPDDDIEVGYKKRLQEGSEKFYGVKTN